MVDTLILSDVHANAAALEGVLAAEPDVDNVVFLGDAVDVGPQPVEAITLLRSIVDHYVIGNHDRVVIDADPDGESDDEHRRWQEWTRSTIGDDVTFLQRAPKTIVASLGGQQFRLHHGDFDPPDGARDWTTRTTPDEAPDVFETIAQRYTEDVVLLGHSHRPFVAEVEGTTFVNPGSVGLQRSDMRPDVARYAYFDGETFDLRSTEYDVSAVVDAYDDLPLPSAFLDHWRNRYRPTPIED